MLLIGILKVSQPKSKYTYSSVTQSSKRQVIKWLVIHLIITRQMGDAMDP